MLLTRVLGGLTASGALAGAGLTAYALWEARQYTLREVTMPVLPAGTQSLRVLHLSDIHMAPDQRAKQGRAIAELLPDVGNLRLFGPATMDLCAVAAGHLDAFFEMNLQPWEWAAGLLIAAEAGARTGTVPTPHGEVVVAAAPGVYEQLVAELQRLYD